MMNYWLKRKYFREDTRDFPWDRELVCRNGRGITIAYMRKKFRGKFQEADPINRGGRMYHAAISRDF